VSDDDIEEATPTSTLRPLTDAEVAEVAALLSLLAVERRPS
jgi:hypothetical protein